MLSAVATLAATAVVAMIVVQNRDADRGRTGPGKNVAVAQSVQRAPNVSSSVVAQPALGAKFVRGRGCRWEGEAANLTIGSSLPAGRALRLAAGVAEIQFEIGVQVIVQSPAVLRLLAADRMQLDVGKATVEIKDERARGFRVITSEATFVDQGTEFGVEVAPGGGSKVHVFRGIVDVDRKGREGRPAPSTPRLLAKSGAHRSRRRRDDIGR